MSRTLIALTAAGLVALAAPASALSFQVDFPTLSYPPVATPDVTQGCTDLTTVSGATCPSSTQ